MGIYELGILRVGNLRVGILRIGNLRIGILRIGNKPINLPQRYFEGDRGLAGFNYNKKYGARETI